MTYLTFLSLALTLALLPLQLLAAEVGVAVASNFMAPMKRIARDFERDTGHKATLSFGATGQLYAQIRNGAPLAVFLAADADTACRLEREGFAVAGSRFTYAIGALVLWSRQPGLVDDGGKILRTGSSGKIAIANPKLAPYGAAALQTLDQLGVRDLWASRLVEGANISQVHQFVVSGSAPIGFVALSQVLENGQIKEGSGWVVPPDLHAPIRQDAVLLNPGKDNPAANALLRYLQSDKVRALIRDFGYRL